MRRPLPRLRRPLLWALCSGGLAAFAQGQPLASRGRASLPELATQVDQVASQLKNAEDNLRVVETQYTERPEPSMEEGLARRFNEAEIQYLLGDVTNASVLFYDLVADKRFKGSPNYAKALYFLSDSLYQQQNFLGAKVYLRELLSLRSEHYKEALQRYVEIAGRLNEFTGIEDYISQARGLNGGQLAPEIAYVYGKWLFKRQDLSREERLRRADDVFEPLAKDVNNPFRLQAQYFLGVALVQRGELDKAKRKEHWAAAVEQFKKITADHSTGERAVRVRELANLSLGRVLYELGGEEGVEPAQRDAAFNEALDRYQEIPRESEHFVDSLYEIAWVQVRKGQFEKAKNATDILLLVAPDSTLAPEAQILQAHLLLKLQKYGEASETYNSVINTYAPVRDEIDALLSVRGKDPVAYFDNLLAKNERNLDVAALLPPVALKWATTQREVADAVRMVNDLEQGRRGVGEAEEVAMRILKAIDERGLETFPALQEGYTRADAVDTALSQIEQALVRIEGYLVQAQLSAEERAELDRLTQASAELKARMANLPTSEKEVEARRQRMQAKVDVIDKDAFKLGYEIQSMQAIVTAVEKWLDDTKGQRKDTPEEEKEFALRLRHEVEALSALQKELEGLRQLLVEERASADAAISGESKLRSQLEDLLKKQHQLIATAESKLPADGLQVMGRAHDVRQKNDKLRERVAAAKKVLRDQVTRRGKQIRDTVTAEQALLQGYGSEVSNVSGNARNLVGRIAFDSFKRVRQQFYDLVLKADVGIVDVAFTRKQDKTTQIQKLSSQKDRELRALDEEFREVLKDVD